MTQLKNRALAGAALLLMLGLWACSEDSTGSNSSYQGLGSKWTASFTGGSSFALTYDSQPDGTVDMTVNGTYVEYSNKFRLLTVTSATGTSAPAVGATAYGLEIPGYAFFLKPVGDANAEPIVLMAAGSCPTADFSANWIIAKFQDSNATPTAASDALGTADFVLSGATKTATINQRRFDTGAALASNAITLTTCTSGAQSFDDGGSGGTMYLTSNGGALVNPGNGIIFASPEMSATVTSTDWDGTYSGLLFNESASGDKVVPAVVGLAGTGGTGTKITDPATDTLDSTSVVFASLAAVAGTKGLFRGTVDGRPFNCAFTVVSGSKVLACNGAGGAASGGVYPSFFFLGTGR